MAERSNRRLAVQALRRATRSVSGARTHLGAAVSRMPQRRYEASHHVGWLRALQALLAGVEQQLEDLAVNVEASTLRKRGHHG